MKQKPRIVILDDKIENTVSLEAYLRREYEVHVFQSAFQALEFVKTHEVYMIISDQRMHEMTGIEFLKACRKIHPNSTRILFSGHLKNNTFKEAIDRDDITYYFEKTMFTKYSELDAILSTTVRNLNL
jgi:DNA-binding NtrC family response regulator